MLTVRPVSEAGFSAMAVEWQACLEASDANPLFMSWPWLYSWWETWSQVLGMELVLLGVFDQQSRLVGIGPFCRRVLVTPAGVRVVRLYMIGNAWRLAPTVRTEYCGIIARRGYQSEVMAVIVPALKQLAWDELVCSDVPTEQLENLGARGLGGQQGYRIIHRTEDRGVRINTAGSFADWLGELGKNTRLKAYNRRGYLQKQGELAFEGHEEGRDGDFFNHLNAFHRNRWRKPAFDREALRFHRLLLQRLHLCGGEPAMSLILYNGRCVSALYDLVVGGCRYNLQAGYEEDFDAKVSLGYLHLGYAIESAFRNERISAYDLLAGTGKKHFYKSHFHGETVKFSTFQVVRNPLLKALYRIQAASPPSVARAFSRRVGL
ncbi:GNAT family N-acetyltransferase [Marinobacter sp. TBZ242]|uniref:GNAT family N-acetyltransferase n=1 Tax=Marinobacter azerbaijanicus TaxID=3050455 RepID=A0ABT7I6G6_9GAMM|nr:GNAT family N-acetyltransferase [Marinobacter sp. TBZ242]MDL0429701.1 GNAT family N-acetyltransferase [Marinobacter sp. TBZ242]